jgi:hypothetical protein
MASLALVGQSWSLAARWPASRLVLVMVLVAIIVDDPGVTTRPPLQIQLTNSPIPDRLLQVLAT